MNDGKNKETVLEIKNLTIRYIDDIEGRVVSAVNDVSLSIQEGDSVGLVGETGAGKTTTALGVLGLVPHPPGEIVSGEIIYLGENLLEKSDAEMEIIRGKEISMIFQDPMTALNPVMTVGDQIAEVISLHNKCSKKEALEKAKEMMELVGIESERSSEYPHQFSGGMKQRIVIAIAIACEPNILIADEPTTALDVTIQAQVLRLIQEQINRLHSSMLLITHDLGVVAHNCNKVAIMYAGEIVERGLLEDVYDFTAHPYTIGLFDSLPSFEEKGARLKPIEGVVVDPSNLPKGCYFAERCKRSREKCFSEHPSLEKLTETHFARCFYPERRK